MTPASCENFLLRMASVFFVVLVVSATAAQADPAQNESLVVRPGLLGPGATRDLELQCGQHCVAELERFQAEYDGVPLSDAFRSFLMGPV